MCAAMTSTGCSVVAALKSSGGPAPVNLVSVALAEVTVGTENLEVVRVQFQVRVDAARLNVVNVERLPYSRGRSTQLADTTRSPQRDVPNGTPRLRFIKALTLYFALLPAVDPFDFRREPKVQGSGIEGFKEGVQDPIRPPLAARGYASAVMGVSPNFLGNMWIPATGIHIYSSAAKVINNRPQSHVFAFSSSHRFTS